MLLKDYTPFFFVSQSVISLVTHLDPHSNLRIWKVPLKKKLISPTGKEHLVFLHPQWIGPRSFEMQTHQGDA